MIIITDDPDHPSIISHKSSGHIIMIDGTVYHFDDLNYFDHGGDWSDIDPPFYYIWNKQNNERLAIPVDSVKTIYFASERIRTASVF